MGRSKRKTTNEAPLESNNLNLEIDMQAIRGKNQELVETVAKIKKEKGILEKQLTLLQKEYFALNSKYVNLKNIFSTVDSTAKLCFPKVAEVVNQLAKIMRVCSVGAAISNTGDLKTQAVSPHRVNGTVIKSPTITISRFSDRPSMTAVARSPILNNSGPSSQTNQETEPSTSRGSSERLSNVQNDENNVSNRERSDFVNRHRRIAIPLAPLNLSEEEEEEETEDENNLEDVEQTTENDEGYCPRLITIEEENDDDYRLTQSNPQLSDDTSIREIRIYLNSIHNPDREVNSSPNNALEMFSQRTSSLSAEASSTMNDNTFVNESNWSPNKSGTNKASEKSSTFFIEDSNWKNNGNNSFTFTNISSIPNVQESEASSSNNTTSDISKILAMESLGLTTAIAHQLATSTPVVSSPRMSSRLSKKSSINNSTKNETVLQNSRPSITKRKTSVEPNVAQVLIKRLNLDKTNVSMHELSQRLDVTPITSSKKVKRKSRKRIVSPSTSSGSRNSDSIAADKPPVTKMKKKGKENKKVLETTVQVTKSSPRPKRNARPGSLREPSLNKKMRRSR